MTPTERDLAIERLQRAIEVLKAMPVQTPCALCLHFMPDKFGRAMCTYWNANVPEEAQEAGCQQWEEGIPF